MSGFLCFTRLININQSNNLLIWGGWLEDEDLPVLRGSNEEEREDQRGDPEVEVPTDDDIDFLYEIYSRYPREDGAPEWGQAPV